MFWRSLTAPEINSLDRNVPVVLPLAAIEQHGPHLPVETDTRIAECLCEDTAARLPGGAVFLPVQAVGCSTHHLALGGTLSLSHEAWLSAVESIAASVFAQGFQTLVLFNAHGGNQAIGQVALEKLGHEHPGRTLALVTWWKLEPGNLATLSETGPGGVGHACEFETSLMLHYAPQSVRTALLPKRGNQPTHTWAEGDMLRGAEVSLYRDLKAMTADGTYGEPMAASAAKGRELAELVCARFACILKDLGKSPIPPQ
jgi:creatinine amidohydrolase